VCDQQVARINAPENKQNTQKKDSIRNKESKKNRQWTIDSASDPLIMAAEFIIGALELLGCAMETIAKNG